MDLKAYYEKIRDTEAQIGTAFPVVISLESASGGKAGVPVEVPRAVAAKMITEGEARLASAEETEAFLTDKTDAKRLADETAAAAKMTFSVISSAEQKLKSLLGPAKKRE